MRRILTLALVGSILAAGPARAQTPGDSVRVRVSPDSAWRHGRILAANDQEFVLGEPQGVEVFNRRVVERLERFERRRPQWVLGTWLLGGLAAGTLTAALASDDASTEDVVISLAAGAGIGLAVGLLDFKFRPGSWVVVPPP